MTEIVSGNIHGLILNETAEKHSNLFVQVELFVLLLKRRFRNASKYLCWQT